MMTDIAQLKAQIAIFSGHDPGIARSRISTFLDGFPPGDIDAVQLIGGTVVRVVGETEDMMHFAQDLAKSSSGGETTFLCGGAQRSRFLFCAISASETIVLRTQKISLEQTLENWRASKLP